MDKSRLIIRIICKSMKLSELEVLSRKRDIDLVYARFFAMYFIKKIQGLSLEEVGKQVGYRNHATVINALKRIEELKFSKFEPYYSYFQKLDKRFQRALVDEKVSPYVYPLI